MSHSQFHCTARVYLDMHGLSFETSICYWQDQPGSRHPRRRRGEARQRPDAPGPPATRPANPDRPGSFAAPTRGSGIADATVAAWRRRAPAAAAGSSRPGGAWGGGTARARGGCAHPTPSTPAARRGGRDGPSATADPRRPALPATPRARSRDRCAAS